MSGTALSPVAQAERLKFTANFFNTAAGSCFTVGVLAPLAAALYNVGPISLPFGAVVIGVAGWSTVGVLLHLFARRILRELP